jgi:flavin-dependent dehydrogenase
VRRDPLTTSAPLIIGAGPAGSAAAITLARAGYRPILIERTSRPTDKVCGDFLSADTIRLVSSLGVDPAALGAVEIDQVRLIHNERIAEAALPFPALGLSRRALDTALLRQAEQAGADARSGQSVRHLRHEADHWHIRIGDEHPLVAQTVFLATGKHDLRDLPRPGAAGGALGLKMYFSLQPEAARILQRTTELTLFPGGYAGMQPVEDGRTVLCIAIHRSAFHRHGGNWPSLIAAIGRYSRRFASMLTGATPLLPKPLAVAAIPYGHSAAVSPAETLFRIGDQAAVIPSLTGDGMAIALHSGHAAAEAWLGGFNPVVYHQALSRTLAPQMRLAGLLHRSCMNGAVQPAATRIAAVFPALLRHAASRTRLPFKS